MPSVRTTSCPAIALAALLATLAPSLAAAVPVTFRVTVPSATPAGDVVYVAGDFQGWNPGSPAHAFSPLPDGRRSLTLDLPAGTPIQFKFTRGTWDNVEKGANGEEIANRTLTPSASATFDFTVATWRDLGTITGHVESFTLASFLGGRRCWVYLPPGYDPVAGRYPVLYMHDGQNLFDIRTSFSGEWHVDEACESLIGSGEIEPLIVVGIENGGANRCFEYTPWSYAGQPCTGGGADAYLTAIRDVLVPHVDATYRTRPGRTNRYMCGSSLGGLVSAYAGYAYDDAFSRVAAVSPSYWWSDGQMIAFAQAQGRPNLTRFYQDMGTIEGGSTSDGNGNGVDDNIDALRAMRDVAVAQGFVAGDNLQSIEASGHTHNEGYWALRFPNLLRFLAGSPALAVPGRGAAGNALDLRVSPIPMRESARVEFTVAAPTRARVDVLDASGRRVETLADHVFAAGRHTVALAADARRTRLPAGVYWVRVATDGSRATRRVVVVN